MKITNGELLSLQKIYAKLMSVDFDSYEQGLELAEEFVLIEDKLKSFEKVKTELVKKFKLEGKADDDPEVKKANEEFQKLLFTNVTITLKEIKEDILKKAKLTGFEILSIKKINELITKESKTE